MLFDYIGWEELVHHQCGKGDIRVDPCLQHPACPLLKHLGTKGAPCILSNKPKPWSKKRLLEALHCGPHKSAMEYQDFLADQFADFVDYCQWIVLPWSHVKKLKNLYVSPTPQCCPSVRMLPPTHC
jgi:hypothetical protein